MAEKIVLVSSSVMFKRTKEKPMWLIVRETKDGEWELPKTIVRRGESSVRAAIRHMGEQAGIRAKVLEEAGRSGGATKIDGRPVTQRFLYYVMVFKDGGEPFGFAETDWLEYDKAAKKLASKRDISMLKSAHAILVEITKERDRRRKAKRQERLN